jgi:hypothetical protein
MAAITGNRGHGRSHRAETGLAQPSLTDVIRM